MAQHAGFHKVVTTIVVAAALALGGAGSAFGEEQVNPEGASVSPGQPGGPVPVAEEALLASDVNVKIVASSSPQTFGPGGGTIWVDVVNDSAIASNINIQFVLPPGVEYNHPQYATHSWDPYTRTATIWSGWPIEPGATTRADLDVYLAAAVPRDFQVPVTASPRTDNDTDPSDDAAVIDIHAQEGVDLAIQASPLTSMGPNGEVPVGGEVKISVSVTNNGTVAAEPAQLDAYLPPGFSYVADGSDFAPVTEEGGLTIPSIEPGGVVNLTFVARVEESAKLGTTGSIVFHTYPTATVEWTPQDNSAIVLVTPVAKSVVTGPVLAETGPGEPAVVVVLAGALLLMGASTVAAARARGHRTASQR